MKVIEAPDFVNDKLIPYLISIVNESHIGTRIIVTIIDPAFLFPVQLIGGGGGNVYATNPINQFFGPICDDTWDLSAVT